MSIFFTTLSVSFICLSLIKTELDRYMVSLLYWFQFV
ncbi:hypothetical protein KSS87_020406 [Heliosperma pusillum]|nr:hypothetical protein KSS87_020406 [Heliosperma pusillum]